MESKVQDAVGGKEPPIPSLPFSFGVSSGTNGNNAPEPAPVPATTTLAPQEHNAKSPPSADIAEPAPSTSVPNFFARALKNTQTAPVSLPSSSLFPRLQSESESVATPALAQAPTIINSVLSLSTNPFSQPTLNDTAAPLKPKLFNFPDKEKENIGTPPIPDLSSSQTTPPNPPMSFFGAAAKPDDNKPPSLLFAGDSATVFKLPTTEPAVAPMAEPVVQAEPEPPKSTLPSFSFTNAANSSPFGVSANPTFASSSEPFSFGKATTEPTKPSFGLQNDKAFGVPTTTLTVSETKTPSFDPKPLFPATGSSFSFGQPSPEPSKQEASAPFSFGKPATAAPTAPSITPSLSFGATPSGNNDKPFSFGTPVPARPVTPPQNESQDQEFRMDESPTRDPPMDMGGPKVAEPKPSLGFSFSSTATFGQMNKEPSNPFAFGASQPSTNPFGSDMTAMNKPEETKPFGGGFGQNSGSQPFSFNAKPSDGTPPRPSTAGSFFSTGPTSSFGFGNNNNNNNSTSDPFGQQQSGSAPSSPAAFTQPGSFNFGGQQQQPAGSTPFQFGSQPGTPVNPSPTLPQAGSAFMFGGNQQSSQPVASFGGSTQPSSGASLFTVGSAASTGPAGQRQIKKLPNRRMTGKR
jgi:hypothetical protein